MKEIVTVYGLNGQVTQEEVDFSEELSTLTPTELDRLEAQVVYTAMMTDTLLEEG